MLQFLVKKKICKKEFNKLKWADEEKLAKQLLQLSEKRKKLISQSNLQSKERLVKILVSNKEHKLFIMSDIKHEPVFAVKEVCKTEKLVEQEK
ncbi:MAG: hypothetical protein HYY52_01965 [Candidatus Melainabacteria bacterium]|nr:hypothetical protein [Candidatus Melainabacteria bacterium]